MSADMFFDRLEPVGDCREWPLYRNADGYGQVSINGRVRYAHRHAFELTNGPIPDGLNVCHRCDNPACCRPEHLFLGTQQQNMADMWTKGRGSRRGRRTLTKCVNGHPYDEENTYTHAATGKRLCRKCHAARSAERRRRLKAA